jgi:STAS domain
MAFKLSVISRDPSGVQFIAAYGPATAQDFPSNDPVHFDRLLGGQWATQRVVLDMDAVPYFDSSAIGWLINIQKQFQESGGALAMHSVQPHVHNILSLLKIERMVPIGRDAAAAKKLLGSEPAPAKQPERRSAAARARR